MPLDVVILGPPGSGKCVVPQTYVLTEAGLIKIGDIPPQFPIVDGTVALLGVNVQGRHGVKQAESFYNGGEKACVHITTRKGFDLTGTINHPVLSLKDGNPEWIRLTEIAVGSRVAVFGGTRLFPSACPRLPQVGDTFFGSFGEQHYRVRTRIPEMMSENLAEWLGWFIGEGCFHGDLRPDGDRFRPTPSHREYGTIAFCNFNRKVMERFHILTEGLFGLTPRRHDDNNVDIHSMRLKRWLQRIGAHGLAADKRVPDCILRSPESCQRAYLKAYFEAEGSVNETGRVELSTASEEMAKQIHLMLLNFGVIAHRGWRRIETKRWGLRKYWRISFCGAAAIKFRERIGFEPGGRKHGALDSLPASSVGWSLEGLPAEFVRKRYADLRKEMADSEDERPRDFWRKAKSVARSLGGNRSDGPAQALVATSMVKRALDLFSEYEETAPYGELRDELDSGRFWDEVVEVRGAGIKAVVDLCVPDGESFVGNGIVCHNTRACVTAAREWFKKHKAGASEIAYLAFTTAAANEAAGRILDEDLQRDVGDRLPFFKTIHSVAYRGMRQERRDIRPVLPADMKHFSTLTGYEGTFAVNNTTDSIADAYSLAEIQASTDWDKCLVAYNLTRASASNASQIEASRKSISRVASRLVGYLEEHVYEAFVKSYEQYKLANGLVDFTDMLVYAMTQMSPFDKVRYVVVDEAQDLSPILNTVVESLFRNADLRLWAGDDDQCIFSFAAADPQIFIDRARRNRKFFLRETNRFGKEIVDFSAPIIRRVRDRVPKELIGISGKSHNIRTTGDFTPVHATKTMLLHRHKAGCQALASQYYREGLPFRNEKGKDPLGPSHSHIREGFRAFLDLADGKEVAMSAVDDMVQKLVPSSIIRGNEKKKILVHGAKKKLEDAKGRAGLMDLVRSKILTLEGANLIATKDYYQLWHSDDLQYYHRVLERGLSIDGEECTVITTMHSSKGREAHRVVIFNERGRRCVEDADSEHRLAYVAATRTMGDLEICAERTVDWAEYPYDYPMKERDGVWR